MGAEIWSTNSDCRTHVFLAGTTGSGKSESLYGMVYNSLCWGSGAVYADGKADISLPFTIWSLCRRMGRDDDFLHLNLLTAGRDPYLDLLEEEKYRRMGESYLTLRTAPDRTHLIHFLGTADFQVQLMTSLLPKADGSGAQWQEKAVNLVDAIIRCLRYKHLRGDLTSGIHAIQKYLGLEDLLTLYKEGKPDFYLMPHTRLLRTT
jgi:intracellular multiplication protein IcmO